MTRAAQASSGTTEPIELQRGRRATPWTDTHDWVGLCDFVEPAGLALYVKLKMHLNVKKGDTEVYPGRDSLAELMGYGKADTLDRYLDQLADAGAISVERRGGPGGTPARCYYTVHDMPAEAYCRESGRAVLLDERCRLHAGREQHCDAGPYTGPMTLGAWYKAHDAAIEARRQTAKAKRDRQREKVRAIREHRAGTAKAQVNPDTPSTGYQGPDDPDTPQTGYQDTPQTGYLDTPSTGAEQGRSLEQDRSEQKPPSPPTSAAAGAVGAGAATGGAPRTALSDEDRDLLNAAVTEAANLRADVFGWSVDAIATAMRAQLAAGHPAALVASTLVSAAADRAGTATPKRLGYLLAKAADRAGQSPPAWAEGPIRYLAPGCRMCERHPGLPAAGCGGCKTDRLTAERDAAEVGGPPMDGQSARDAIRAANTAAAARREERRRADEQARAARALPAQGPREPVTVS